MECDPNESRLYLPDFMSELVGVVIPIFDTLDDGIALALALALISFALNEVGGGVMGLGGTSILNGFGALFVLMVTGGLKVVVVGVGLLIMV